LFLLFENTYIGTFLQINMYVHMMVTIILRSLSHNFDDEQGSANPDD